MWFVVCVSLLVKFYFRDDVEHIFEVFIEIARPVEKGADPFILQIYPEEFDDKVWYGC